MPVPAARPYSHVDLLHRALGEASLLIFPAADDAGPWLSAGRRLRAIGAVYHPDAEWHGNWVPTVMGRRYDALCYFEATAALYPLHLEKAHPAGEQETSRGAADPRSDPAGGSDRTLVPRCADLRAEPSSRAPHDHQEVRRCRDEPGQRPQVFPPS
jgi:hypothetical protein